MLTIKPANAILGATVTGVDLNQPLSAADFGGLLRALGQYGVLCFPNQLIEAPALRDFSINFGSLQMISRLADANAPEVSILSNVVENGDYIGTPDAGQDWHTDMTYNRVPGFVNVLVAHKVPMRDGKPLGGTAFTNTQAAYDDLPSDVKTRLTNATALHDHNQFQELMRSKGSTRPAQTEAQKRSRPPVSHPVFLTHPISGRKVIYVNPGFTARINELSPEESDATLKMLYAHVMQPKYAYTHHWSVGDVLLWDHLGTWHCALADYAPNEYRLMKRCQVMADKVFDPAFLQEKLRVVA
jgi:taurine dioxygenase